jgi:hypothetical protein
MEPLPQTPEGEADLCPTCGKTKLPATIHRHSKWRSCGMAVVGCIIVLALIYLFSEGLAISCNAVLVRAAKENDKVYDAGQYFGIWPKDNMTIRNIVVAEGTFTKDTWLSASLCAVKAGSVEVQNAFTVGRSPNRIGEPIWISMKITLALGEYQKPGGRRVVLGAAGHSRGSGQVGDDNGPLYNVMLRTKKTLPGRLRSGKKYILYVEGDRECEVSREMSLEDFAAKNNGNYFVVAAQLH